MQTENNYQETDLGNVAPNPRGEYSTEEAYEYLDTVSYRGGSYMCLAELGETITGIPPTEGENTDTWQMIALPGKLTPEYIAAHDVVVSAAKRVEASKAAVELIQEEVESSKTDVQQLHSDIQAAAGRAEESCDSAAGYAQAAENSRSAAQESEENVRALVTGFNENVDQQTGFAKQTIEEARQQAVNVVKSQQDTSVQEIEDQAASYISQKELEAKNAITSHTELETQKADDALSEVKKKIDSSCENADEKNAILQKNIQDAADLNADIGKTVQNAKNATTSAETAAEKAEAAAEFAKKNSESHEKEITALRSAVKELKKRVSIDTYDELAEALVSGTIENYVSAGDELMVNKISSLSITSNNGNLSFTVSDEQDFTRKIGRIDDDTYVFEYRDNAWRYLEEEIQTSDYGFSVAGTPSETDLIFVKMNYTQVSHTFVDFDPSGANAIHPKDEKVKHFAVLEQTYVPDAFNFDYPESAICITPGYTLTAGKYYIYNIEEATSDWWCNYKRLYYTFEILNDIVATEITGDIQLRFYSRGDRENTGDARGIYELICKPYCCATEALYNSDSIKFVGQITQPGEEYKDLRTIEGFSVNQAMESAGIIYNNLGHVCYGNNEWNVSNLRQRMNSCEKSMRPVRTHKNDTINGMSGAKGFMWGLDPRFINLIKPCIVFTEHGMNDEFKRYQLYTCEDTATLLSIKEMSFNFQTDEGQIAKLYGTYTGNQLVNTEVASRAKARQAGSTPQDYRWSRSAHANDSSYARLVAPSGAYGGDGAHGGYRFAPAYIIGVADNRESIQSAEA